jgi:serine/threonine protein kinase
MISQQFGRYEIRAELGRGGMASVYLAYDPSFKREVAVKVLPREFLHDPLFRARFEREAEVVAALEHAAIVPVYDFGEEDGQPYLVMRFMGGGSLADRLKSGPVTVKEARNILAHLSSALDKAHTRGVIHRDLKPGNILFDEESHPYLSDFGIARIVESNTSITGGRIVGTPAYMSPEQFESHSGADGRSDIYSLGIILFVMLSGRLPFEAETPPRLMLQHLMEPVPDIRMLRADLPPGVQDVIDCAMAKSPDGRYSTASEMLAALDQAIQSRRSAPAARTIPSGIPYTPPSNPSVPGIAAPSPSRLPVTPILLGCTALLAVVAVLAIAATGGIYLFGQGAAAGLDAAEPGASDATAEPDAQSVTEAADLANRPPLAASIPPQPTPTAEPLIPELFTVSIDNVLNASLDFASPPTGSVILGGVPFDLSGEAFKSQASASPHTTAPTSARIIIDLPRASRIFILLNTGNGLNQFRNRVIGEITVDCDGREILLAELVLGKTIREWHSIDGVVASADEPVEVWRGPLAQYPSYEGYIDMLTFDLPSDCQTGDLQSVTISDTSVDSVGSLDPALNLLGITVEYTP